MKANMYACYAENIDNDIFIRKKIIIYKDNRIK